MDLTGEQRRVVDHRRGWLRVVGGAGTGKTTALVARYRRLVTAPGFGGRASAVLVLCGNRAAADRFRDAVLPDLAGGFDALPITTFFGLAYDLVARQAGPLTLLTGAERRRAVARALATDDPARWPTLGHLLGRQAFAAEVASALARPSPHPEVAAFGERYRRQLAAEGRIDGAGLLAAAAELPTVASFDHVLVDDYHRATPAMATLLGRVAAAAVDVVVASDRPGRAGSEVGIAASDEAAGGGRAGLGAVAAGAEAAGAADGAGAELDLGDVGFRRPGPPELVVTRHPSLEPEAVAGELLAAHRAGVAWSGMAVLLRRPRHRAPAIARALARHRIPVRPGAPAWPAAPGGLAGDDPVVGSVVDMLRWAAGDESALHRLLVSPLSDLDAMEARGVRRRARLAGADLAGDARLAPLVALRDHLREVAATATPSELAFAVWERGLAHLVDAEAEALDGLVAFLDALAREAERNPHHRLPDVLPLLDDGGVDPDPWRVDAAATDPAGGAVTVTSIGAAAGMEWHTVVVAGCVEGELPTGTDLHGERRLFALACSRATHRLVATAGPEPGVLLSRFVEGWPRAGLRIPHPPGRAPAFRRPTVNDRPITTDAGLTLSATQLDTYDDCPLRYAYRYVLRVRDEGGVRADLGTLVHQVLARFLDPQAAGGAPRTRERLLTLAEELWRHDIARYRPQVEEARRDFFAMLDLWWQIEGQSELAPDVLAVERAFEVEVAGRNGHRHRLRGSIDRIDRVERADGTFGLRIVDYKTGRKEPRSHEMAGNIQLAVYHLAATRDPDLAAHGPVTELRLLYLRTMHAFDQEVTAGHAESTEQRVLDVAERIRREEFEPSVDATCRWCSFQRLCPLQPEGREVVSSWP